MPLDGVGALLVAALALTGCGGSAEPTTVVPNLIGKDAAGAERLVESRGLGWRWDDGTRAAPSNGFLLADTIYAQAPSPGERVRLGTEVVLVPGSSKIYRVPPAWTT